MATLIPCPCFRPLQDQDLVRQRFGGVGKAPRKTGVHTLFGWCDSRLLLAAAPCESAPLASKDLHCNRPLACHLQWRAWLNDWQLPVRP